MMPSFEEEERAVAAALAAVAAAELEASPLLCQLEAATARHSDLLIQSRGRRLNKEAQEVEEEIERLRPRAEELRALVRRCEAECRAAKASLEMRRRRTLIELASKHLILELQENLSAHRSVFAETKLQLQRQYLGLVEERQQIALKQRQERARARREAYVRACEHKIGVDGFLFDRTMLRCNTTSHPILPHRPYANQHAPGEVPPSSRAPGMTSKGPVHSHISQYLARTQSRSREAQLAPSKGARPASALPRPSVSVGECPRTLQPSPSAPLLTLIRPRPQTATLPLERRPPAGMGDSTLVVERQDGAAHTAPKLQGPQLTQGRPTHYTDLRPAPLEVPTRPLNRSWSAEPRVQSMSHTTGTSCYHATRSPSAGSALTLGSMTAAQSRTRLGSSASTESVMLINANPSLNRTVTSALFLQAKLARASKAAAARLAAAEGRRPPWHPVL